MNVHIIIVDKGILWDLLQIKSPDAIDYVFDSYTVEIECMARNLIPNISKDTSGQYSVHVESAIIAVKIHLLIVVMDYLVGTLQAKSPESHELIQILMDKSNTLIATVNNISNN